MSIEAIPTAMPLAVDQPAGPCGTLGHSIRLWRLAMDTRAAGMAPPPSSLSLAVN